MSRHTTGRSFSLLAALLIVAAPAAVRAQSFGIKGGLSYGSVPNNNGVVPGTLSAHSGFAIGVGLATGGVLGFGVEGLYAQRGFTSSTAGASQSRSYVDVPLYLKLQLPVPAISPFVYAGPQGSYELNCDAGGGNGTCPSGSPKITYAGIIGAGLKFGVLGGLSLEGRYVYGLSNLNLSTVSNSGNYQARSFMLLAGIGF